jgi:mono/diheme cytochrome c family protein
MSSRAITALAVALAGIAQAVLAGGPLPVSLPERLSETGLYSGTASGRIDPANLAFEPQYPLWTDGAEKARWIRLPEGATIDARDTELWRFPVGTKLWKEFAFEGRKVETRMLWHAHEGEWAFATYVWNEEQTEAFLAPDEGIRNHVALGPRARHSIPSRTDCLSCHGSGATPVLGFNALQLSDDRDPLAPHARPLEPGMLTIRALDRLGLLSPRREDLVASPPRIDARSPRERAVLGYLSSNCGSCHSGRGPLEPLGLVLAHGGSEVPAPAIATAVGVEGHYVVPGIAPDNSRRIAPGSPDASVVTYRMASRSPSSQMPPLGTAIVDREALALIRAWIAEDLAARTSLGDRAEMAYKRGQ